MRTASENLSADTPTIAAIRRIVPKHGDVVVQTILIHALNELKDLVNVGKNLTDAQIRFITAVIISKYGYYRVEEIKYVLYRAIGREKLFDRLDPNIVLGWFVDYDAERTAIAIEISEQEDARAFATHPAKAPDSMNLTQYRAYLESRIAQGDTEAAGQLDNLNILFNLKKKSSRTTRQRDEEFKRFYYDEYLAKKNNRAGA